MVARLTQQIVEVLGQDTTFAKAKVTQQIVEVIGQDTTFHKAIFVNQSVEVIGYNSSVPKAIFAAQSIEVLGTRQPDPIVDSLSLTQTVVETNTTHNISLTDPLSLTDALNLINFSTHTITQSITVADIGSGTTASIFNESPSDTLTISSAFSQQFFGNRSLVDNLTPIDFAVGFGSKAANDFIYPFTDLATFTAVFARSLTDSLALTQTTVQARAYSLTDSVTLVDSPSPSVIRNPNSSISLTDLATYTKFHIASESVTDSLILTQKQTFIFTLSLIDTLTIVDKFQQGFNSCVETCNLNTYSPQISYDPVILNGVTVIPPLSFSPIPLPKACNCSTTVSLTVTFTYPFNTPTTTLILPAPEFNNHDAYKINRITRVTRGNSLKIYRNPNWPTFETLSYAFTYLTEQQKQDLLSFMLVSVGGQVGLLDFENRQWNGFILNPKDAVSQTGRYVNSANIQFQGVEV